MPVEDETPVAQDEISDEEPEEEKECEQDERQNLPDSAHSGFTYRKLATIIAIVAILLGFVLSTYQTAQSRKPETIYATRYSKEHRFRPAASPIITETLKDGRIRIRGAEPSMNSPPKPTTTKRPQHARATRKKKPPIKKTY